ncbi:hypothetical protein ACFXJ5_23215 [Streptomyces sp. NPDC059373]
MLMTVSGCSSSGSDRTDKRSTSVCDGKLTGDAFETVVGSGGVIEERTSDFRPKKWTAYGYCNLYSKEHFVEIDYLWYSDTITDLERVKSPSPSNAKTFRVGSAVGYVERNRARVVIPCSIPGTPTSEHHLLQVEVKDNPPSMRTLDGELGKAFTSAATIAARYIAGEVFDCAAIQSGASGGSSSPSPSAG